MILRTFACALGLGLAVALCPAFATTYTTSGCFSNPAAPAAGTSAFSFCTSTGSTFTFNDIGGGTETITYTDASFTPATAGSIDLGEFSFSSSGIASGASYSADFTLSFTSPPGTTGTFNAVLLGQGSGPMSTATISFSSSTEPLSGPQGTFDILLPANVVQLGSADPDFAATGNVSNVPEPASRVLFVIGCTALASLLFLRLQAR